MEHYLLYLPLQTKSECKLTELSNGLINRVLKLETKGETFILRLFEKPNPLEEQIVSELSLEYPGICPQFIETQENCRLEEYFDGRSLEISDINNKSIKQIIEIIQKIHSITPKSQIKESFLCTYQEYAQFIIDNYQSLDTTLKECFTIEQIQQIVNDFINLKDEIVLCHNDCHFFNFLIDKSDNIKVIDFEFSKLNYWAYDLAVLLEEFAYVVNSSEQLKTEQNELVTMLENVIVDNYNSSLNKDDLIKKVRMYGGYVNFFWFLWACKLTLSHPNKISYAIQRYQYFIYRQSKLV